MAKTLLDTDWALLVDRIKDGKCTPFLGAGVNAGVLPTGADIAQKWAAEEKYPLDDKWDLARVAEFIAIKHGDKMYPKEKILKMFAKITAPDFAKPDEALGALADLDLPVFITTNYDDFMVRALESRKKDPKREFCRWNSLVAKVPSLFSAPGGFDPTPANPVVFHLHGMDEYPQSLVLTEEDYLDFLVSISRFPELLPPRIQEALTDASLLFIGYRLADWTFRVIFRGLVNSMEASLRRRSIAVFLVPDVPDDDRQQALDYLNAYFEDIKVRIFWGNAGEFALELRDRLK